LLKNTVFQQPDKRFSDLLAAMVLRQAAISGDSGRFVKHG